MSKVSITLRPAVYSDLGLPIDSLRHGDGKMSASGSDFDSMRVLVKWAFRLGTAVAADMDGLYAGILLCTSPTEVTYCHVPYWARRVGVMTALAGYAGVDTSGVIALSIWTPVATRLVISRKFNLVPALPRRPRRTSPSHSPPGPRSGSSAP